MTARERARLVLDSALAMCDGNRSETYMVLVHTCALFAMDSQGQENVLELMIEALQAGVQSVRGARSGQPEPFAVH